MFSKAKVAAFGCTEVALDHKGNAHLYQYTPHSDGREGVRSSGICSSQLFGIESPVSTNLKKSERSVECFAFLGCFAVLLRSNHRIKSFEVVLPSPWAHHVELP